MKIMIWIRILMSYHLKMQQNYYWPMDPMLKSLIRIKTQKILEMDLLKCNSIG